MKYVVRVLGVIVVVPIVLGVLALVWPDAELDADAGRLLAQQRAPVDEARNLFNGLMGFNAPRGEADFVAYAAQRIEATNRRLAEHERSAVPDTEIDFSNLWPVDDASRTAGLGDLCSAGETPCAPYWRAHGETIAELADRHRTRLQRLARLHTLSDYAMTMTPDARAPLPPAQSLLAAHKLRLNELGMGCGARGVQTSLAGISDEIALARRIMRDSEQLLSTIVAVEQLRQALYVYAECADLAAAQGANATPLQALTSAETSLRKPYFTMFREARRLLAQLSLANTPAQSGDALTALALRPFLKRNRSANLAFASFSTLAAISELPPANVAAEAPRRLAALTPPWHEYVLNPMGAILHNVAAPTDVRYVYRIHDVNGLIALVNAKLELRARRVPAERINDALATSAWRSPYHAGPLEWEPRTHTLSFPSPDGTDRANRLRHAP